MANPEHLEIVQQRAVAIQRWNEQHPDERLDLVGVDLAGAVLTGAILVGADLSSD